MKKSDLELRINELNLELSKMKSDDALAKSTDIQASAEGDFKFQNLANNIQAFIAYVNANTLRYEFVNELFVKSFGISKEKIIGSHVKDIIGEENYQFALKYINEVKSGKPCSYENSFNMVSGKRWLHVDYSPVIDSNNRIFGIALVCYDITERKQAETILQETEEHYKVMFESSPIAINITQGTSIIYANSSYLKMFGFSTLDDLKNVAPLEKFTPEWRPKIQENIQRRAKGMPVPDSYEVECFRNDGSKFPVLMYLTRAMFSDGMATIAFTIDTTEHKILEKKLQESEKRYRTIFETATEGIWSIDKEHRIIFLNKRMSDMLGYLPKDIMGRKVEEFMLEEDLKEHQKRMEQRRDGFGGNYECRFCRSDGSILWTQVSATVLTDSQGNFEGSFGMYTDITERKVNELELIKTKNLLIEAERIANIGTWEWNLKTNQSYWSDNLFAIYGRNKIAGTPPLSHYLESYHIDDREKVQNAIDLTINQNIPYFVEYRIFRENDGEEVYIQSKGEIFFNNAGEAERLIGVAKDITEQRRAEQELIKAKEQAEENDRLKSAFLTNMSHEIRTPLNGILGFAELLKEPDLSTDDQQDYLQTMQISGARMLNTLNSIIDISKIESGLTTIDIKETNINEKVEFTYKFFKPETENKGLQFIFKNGLLAEEAIIETDNEKVYAILTNLVRNAIKFTYEGFIEFGYEKKRQYLEFFVKDSGIGIPKNQQEIIFERFRQGNDSHNRGYEGSGLGLSLSKYYVEMLGGKIWVESDEMKGSTFYFTIPYNPVLDEIKEITDVVPTEHKEAELKNLKILIVEDDEISSSLLTRNLQKISKEVLHAVNGVQAVDVCRNNSDLDLLLMDIRMPQMNGLEATQQIRQFNKNVIIIAQTAYGFKSDREKAIEAGCNDYITKPIDKDLLFELIKKHCDKQNNDNKIRV